MRGGQLTEEGGEAELARVVQVLVAEDERLVLQECGVDLGDDGGVEVGGKIHAEDLGADTAADPADVEDGAGGHARVSFRGVISRDVIGRVVTK